MRIKSVEFKNFCGFGNNISKIDFGDNTNLYLVTGISGIGKSTIARAIIFGLYGKSDYSQLSSLVNRINKKGLYVKINVECNGNDVIIERGLNPKIFNVKVNGISKEGDQAGKSNIQNWLEKEIFEIPYHVFKNIIVISLNDFKSFINMKPKDKRDIVDRIFGFSVLNEMLSEVKREKNNIKSEIKSIDDELNTLEENYQSIQHKLENFKKNSKEKDQQKVNELQQYIDKIEDDKKKLKEAQQKLNEKYKEINRLLTTKKDEINKKQNELKEYRKKIKLYENNKCPTCSSDLNTQEHRDEHEKALQKAEEIPNQIEKLETELNEYQEKINKNQNNQQQVLSKISSLKTKVQNYESEIHKISNTDNSKEKWNEFKEILNQIDEKTKIKEDNQQEKIKQDNFLGLFEELLGENGIKSIAIQKVLPSLNRNIQSVIQDLHIPFKIKFDEQFNCKISQFGEEIDPTTLSLGQEKRVDFAIIISILKILKTRYPSLNLLFIDELFSSLDDDNVFHITRILHEFVKENELNACVINHKPLPNDLFDYRINIYNNNGFSQLETIENK